MYLDKLIIGAASFGQSYGIANTEQLSSAQAHNLISLCQLLGMNTFDTAADYGDSEKILGEHSGIHAYSKLSGRVDLSSWSTVYEAAQSSKSNLSVGAFTGLSVHNFQALFLSGRAGVANMEKLKDLGIAQSWGISVYEVSELEPLLKIARPDFIQAPVSLVDRRFLSPEVLGKLERHGTQLHARSIYLQGALLMGLDRIPKRLEALKSIVEKISTYANEASISVSELLFRAVAQIPQISKIVVGVNSHHQVAELGAFLTAERADLKIPVLNADASQLALFDPRTWS